MAGLDELQPESELRMHEAMAHGPGHEPDHGGSDPAAAYVQPTGTTYDRSFAGFTSDQPSTRLRAAYAVVSAPDDFRTVPALLHHLEHDPDPVVRKMIASRVLTRLGGDPLVDRALRRTAECDQQKGVRWAGRYALRLLTAGA